MTRFLSLVLLAIFVSACATTTSQPKSRVFFVEPRDDANVAQEFKVVMGVEGMTVKPLGDMSADTGHHHLLINAENVNEGEIVPVDKPEIYKHFGKGQTETMVKLAPGKYKLTLQFADGAHRSYGKPMRATISVTVK
jgi:Domain of unknown function (DUF4399)